jgi:hypothetical protein
VDAGSPTRTCADDGSWSMARFRTKRDALHAHPQGSGQSRNLI